MCNITVIPLDPTVDPGIRRPGPTPQGGGATQYPIRGMEGTCKPSVQREDILNGNKLRNRASRRKRPSHASIAVVRGAMGGETSCSESQLSVADSV